MISKIDSLLIGELRNKFAGQDTRNFGVVDFLSAFGSPLEATMYLRLFWPSFIRFEEMVFMEDTLEDAEDRQKVRETLLRYKGDKTRTEQSFNLVEIPSGVFSTHASDSSDDVDEYLAATLKELWAHRLHMVFPGDMFFVEIVPANETGGEQAVVFYTRR